MELGDVRGAISGQRKERVLATSPPTGGPVLPAPTVQVTVGGCV